MADLERCALALLRDATLAGWVQERLDARVRHVLIDEFQDTSPLQWHALHAWLVGYAGAGGGASGQRPPGVFIVGDPKQSIYRFRRAEPRVFDAAREFVVEGLGGSRARPATTRGATRPRCWPRSTRCSTQAQRARRVRRLSRPHHRSRARTPRRGRARAGARRRGRRGPRRAPAATVPWRDSLTARRASSPRRVLREHEARARRRRGRRRCCERRHRAAATSMVLCRKRESLRLVAEACAALHIPFAAPEDVDAARRARGARPGRAARRAGVAAAHACRWRRRLRARCSVRATTSSSHWRAAGAPAGDWWRALRERDGRRAPALARAARAAGVAGGGRRGSCRRTTCSTASSPKATCARASPRRCRRAPRAPRSARSTPLLAQSLTLDGARYATPYNFVRALKRRAVTVRRAGAAATRCSC